MERNKVASSNLLWRLLERFGAQGVTLVVSIALARVLDPDVYGTVALITVITTILQVFIDSGLGTALVQKKEADSLDFSSVFYFNFIICIVLYAALFLFAPWISRFYGNNDLIPLIRVLGLLLIISGFKNIQNAYVSRNLMFKLYFFATLGGTVSAAIAGIWMAYHGFGVWALVIQNLVNQAMDTMILWITVKWRPTKEFSFDRLKGLFKFSWKLLVSSLLDNIWNQLSQIIIGKVYTTSDLALYNKGNEYPHYATSAINSSIDSVLLPVMSKCQDSVSEVKAITRRAIKISSYILWPMMMGFAACSVPFVRLVLTEKWLPCVPYLILFCFVYVFYPIHTANLNAIKALGRSDLFLKIEIMKKIISLVIILFALRLGPIYLAIGSVVCSLLNQLINSWPNRRLLDYSYLEQIYDIAPYMLLSIFMASVVYCVSFINLPDFITLIIQILLGIVIYVGISWILKDDSLFYCIKTMKELRKGKK